MKYREQRKRRESFRKWTKEIGKTEWKERWESRENEKR